MATKPQDPAKPSRTPDDDKPVVRRGRVVNPPPGPVKPPPKAAKKAPAKKAPAKPAKPTFSDDERAKRSARATKQSESGPKLVDGLVVPFKKGAKQAAPEKKPIKRTPAAGTAKNNKAKGTKPDEAKVTRNADLMQRLGLSGRPHIPYDPEIGNAICEAIARSSRGIRRIVEDLGDIVPGVSTIYRWMRESKPFAEQYARAKEEQAETLLDECIEISDDGRNDWMETAYGMRPDREVTDRSKLRVHVRITLAEKLAPKKYGPKAEHTLKGELNVRTRTVIVPAKNPATVVTVPMKREGEDE